MSVHWTTHELDGRAFDPEPDDDDNGPWCLYPDRDLWGQGLLARRATTITTVPLTKDYL